MKNQTSTGCCCSQTHVWTFLSKFLKFQVQFPVYLPSLHPPAYLYICSLSICCCANVLYQQLISLKQTSLHQLVHFHFHLCGSLCCISSSRNYTFTLCHTSQAHTHTQDTHTRPPRQLQLFSRASADIMHIHLYKYTVEVKQLGPFKRRTADFCDDQGSPIPVKALEKSLLSDFWRLPYFLMSHLVCLYSTCASCTSMKVTLAPTKAPSLRRTGCETVSNAISPPLSSPFPAAEFSILLHLPCNVLPPH